MNLEVGAENPIPEEMAKSLRFLDAGRIFCGAGIDPVSP